MEIIVEQPPGTSAHEFTTTLLRVPGLQRSFLLDINFSEIVDRSRQVNVRALDFLFISAVVYASDKIISRTATADRWTRTFELTIPLQQPEEWLDARAALEAAVSFLTGDRWTISFVQARHVFQAVRPNRRRRAKGYPASPIVTLLSGGLDSFIGALDALAEYDHHRLQFVSHYDGHVSGPGADQENLRILLESRFPGRISHLQVRTGVRALPEEEEVFGQFEFEKSFRSRSLIFIGLGLYTATMIGPNVPLAIPENGPIALNMPLNSSRRGACSTRTVHPYFLELLQGAVDQAGLQSIISNPYALKTKGEMVRECRFPDLLRAASDKTNSCGKAGRKTYWANRKAKGCGTCIPCLFRRASLHVIGADDEAYGNDVFASAPQKYADFHALLGLIRSNPTIKHIGHKLIANGHLPIDQLDDYAAVVRRMLDEVTVWIREKGSVAARQLGGIRNA